MAAVKRTLVHRLASAALLAAWLAPSGLGLATALHVDLHHGNPAAEWALAVEHGHSHEVEAAGHDHSATRAEAPRAPSDPLAADVTGDGPPALIASEPGARPAPSRPPRPSPRELYTLHCALLR
jgi:hypothetical protein